MSQHDQAERKLARLPAFVPSKLRPEGDHAESFDFPAEWTDDPTLNERVRVFVGKAEDPIERRLVHAGELARSHRGFAIAFLGVRVVILRDGRVLQTARNPDRAELRMAMFAAEEVDAARIVLERPRLVAEEALDHDALRESSELQERSGGFYSHAIFEARHMLLCGLARAHGPVLLQLVEREIEAMGEGWRLQRFAGPLHLYDQVRARRVQGLAGVTELHVAGIGEPGELAPGRVERLPAGATMLPGGAILSPARLAGDLCPECGERAEECRCDSGAATEAYRRQPEELLAHVASALELYQEGVPHADPEGAANLVRGIVSGDPAVSQAALVSLREQLEQRGPKVSS